jgi:hypothetical protein
MNERYRGGDRRTTPSTIKNRPRSSPASLLILGVTGILAASALAAALLGNASEETTPHGQVLAALQLVADAQEEHFRQTGAFALWLQTLDVTPRDGVQLGMVRATDTAWEALASHPVGLTCIQEGRVDGDRPRREAPVCYHVTE